MEAPEISNDIMGAFSRIRFRDKVTKWIKLSSAIGWLLIVGGVAGEYVFDGKFSRADADVQTYDRKVVSKAQLDAATADLKRVELESRIVGFFGPRQLTADQRARIVGRLSGLAGVKIDIFVLAIGNPWNEAESNESIALASAITDTLRSAQMNANGWVVNCSNAFGANNLVINTAGDDARDIQIATRVLKALSPELGTYPLVQNSGTQYMSDCSFSGVDRSKPHGDEHDASVSITVGRKVESILTHEMLEPTVVQKP